MGSPLSSVKTGSSIETRETSRSGEASDAGSCGRSASTMSIISIMKSVGGGEVFTSGEDTDTLQDGLGDRDGVAAGGNKT